MQAKELPDIPFHPVSESRRTCFFLYYNPQAAKGAVILLYKDDKIPRGHPSPGPHHSPEIQRPCNPLLFSKPERPFHAAIIY